MTQQLLRSAACLAVLLCSPGLPVRAQEVDVSASPDPVHSPLAIVEQAFERMFNYPSVRSVRLRIYRNGRLVSRRNFDIVYQRLEGQGHTLLRFTEPEYLRGNGLLIIESSRGTNDAWLYQPEERRPRRVGTHQKGDSFFGSDLTYEDLEHQAWSRYELARQADATVDGQATYVIEAQPPADSQYSKLLIWIEKARLAVARIDFYRGSSSEPRKTLRVSMDTIAEQDGVLMPRFMLVEQHGREASTRVEFVRFEIDPGITARVFSAMRLQRENEDLFDLVRRSSERSGNENEAD